MCVYEVLQISFKKWKDEENIADIKFTFLSLKFAGEYHIEATAIFISFVQISVPCGC